ncbi:MAG: glycerophosphodiester phosphodiesterase [Rectinemataceae bacterium]
MSGLLLALALTAHAGCLDTAPNTRESFETALAYPVDFIEADIRFGSDGVAYLSHDALSGAEQSGAMKLSELLELVSARPLFRLNLDLKEFSALSSMADLIDSYGMRERVLLTGVGFDAVDSVRQTAKGLPYLLNAFPSPVERYFAFSARALAKRIQAAGAVGLNTHYRGASRLLSRTLSSAGLALSVWTVDDEAEMRRFLSFPVNNITSRRIDRLLKLREQTEAYLSGEKAVR